MSRARAMVQGAENLIKTPQQINKMRIAGQLTARVLEAVGEIVAPGITTLELDEFCEKYIKEKLHALPGSKGIYDYPYSINTSVNKVVCHGMPSKYVLKKGDILNIDVTVRKDGYYGDSSRMFAIGDIPHHARRLVDVTHQCLYLGIKMVRPGLKLGDLGEAIYSYAKRHNYSVVREYCGHGIGNKLHEEPQILHYGRAGTGLTLEPGMTFTIEPMINQGKRDIKRLKDGWTIVTKDYKLSAQWEHTVLVTETGVEVLTLRSDEQL